MELSERFFPQNFHWQIFVSLHLIDVHSISLYILILFSEIFASFEWDFLFLSFLHRCHGHGQISSLWWGSLPMLTQATLPTRNWQQNLHIDPMKRTGTLCKHPDGKKGVVSKHQRRSSFLGIRWPSCVAAGPGITKPWWWILLHRLRAPAPTCDQSGWRQWPIWVAFWMNSAGGKSRKGTVI